MAIRTARRQGIKKHDEVQQTGIFTGTAQNGPARPKRAHALAEELLARGCLFIQNQVWDEAAREFRKAIKMEPEYAEAYNNLGLCLLYAKKPQEAVEALDKALEYFPGWHIAEANLGLALARIGENDAAASTFEKSVMRRRNQPAVWLALGDVQAATGKVEKALESYEVSVSLSPKNDMAFYRIGMLQARRNKLDEAETALRKALDIEPDNAEATAVLGAISARRGRLNEARDLFTQVLEFEKVPAPAQRGMHRLQVFRQGLRKAFDEWRASMPEATPLAVCYYNLGLAHLAAGNQSEAKDAFAHVSELQPNWPEPLIWYGFFAALDGDGMAARKNWEAALKMQPNKVALLREQLGYLAVAMGLQKESEVHFTDAIKQGRKIPAEDMQPDQHANKRKPSPKMPEEPPPAPEEGEAEQTETEEDAE